MAQRKVTEDLPAFMLEEGEDAPQMVREKRTPDRVPAFLRYLRRVLALFQHERGQVFGYFSLCHRGNLAAK